MARPDFHGYPRCLVLRFCKQCLLPKAKKTDDVAVQKITKKVDFTCDECRLTNDRVSHYSDKTNKLLNKKLKNWKNKEQRREDRARYYQRYKDKLIEQSRLYRLNNPAKPRPDYYRNRCKTDIGYKLILNYRTRTYIAFKQKRVAKLGHTLDFLGCSPKQLRDYLSERFHSGMTLGNYGSHWHIDHIIPCSRFDLENQAEVRACFHYSNVQPMLALDNIRKNDGDDSFDWETAIQDQIAKSEVLRLEVFETYMNVKGH